MTPDLPRAQAIVEGCTHTCRMCDCAENGACAPCLQVFAEEVRREEGERSESRWLRFVPAGQSATGKTVILDVESKTQKTLLGQIKWFGRWRQYAFFPCRDTCFNQECLADIIDKMQQLMAAQ